MKEYNMSWEAQRLCIDEGDYELVVEKQKQDWACDQKMDMWKWSVVFHGTVIDRGMENDIEKAKQAALEHVPQK